MAGGVVDDTLVQMLEEALAAVGEQDPALRARLLARLAIELSFSEQRERRAELSGEAVEIARRVGDTSGLGFALVARHWSLWGPTNVQERLEAANDLLGLAERSGDERLAAQGHRWRMIDLLELGEMDAVDIEIDAYAQIAARRKRLSEELYVQITARCGCCSPASSTRPRRRGARPRASASACRTPTRATRRCCSR